MPYTKTMIERTSLIFIIMIGVLSLLNFFFKDDDMVVVPNVSVFWGILRYSVQNNWGKPLDVANLVDKPMWRELKNKLGTNIVEFVHLNPSTDHVTHNKNKYIISNNMNNHEIKIGSTIWIVFRKSYNETIMFSKDYIINSRKVVNNELIVLELKFNNEGNSKIENLE